VILDDWFHSIWPGVVEGYYQFVYDEMSGIGNDEVYPFLVCESKLYLTNDKGYHQLYYDTLLNHPQLSPKYLTRYAHEKERGKLLYEMNGVNYLKCKSRASTMNDVGVTEEIQNLWSQRVY